ncbi:hypothetical protein TCAL_05204 [Tigriopus californicus]|uniref:Cytochrome P450 n=1 Tax=Tigriopus californicus TaxID=6832 RepID=A0A553NXL4_TIGCA|nr:cytochrome P450 6k1-like [Tigriopus californicus]TRY70169.1 hypothetical protein TCAL_05204 [Tigriopus californicus]
MWLEILCVSVVSLWALYWYLTKDYKHWTNLGIAQDEPSFPWGSLLGEVIKGKKSSAELLRDQYDRYNTKAYGGYIFLKPILVIRDPELAKIVLVRDFNNFVDRSGSITRDRSKHSTLTDKIWSRQLTTLVGDEWKCIRSTLSPIFTSGKMKVMFSLMKVVSNEFVDVIRKYSDEEKAFDLKDLCGRFTMDSISSCAIGVNAGSFHEDETAFVKNAKGLFDRSILAMLFYVLSLIPGVNDLFGRLGISVSRPQETKFFYNVIKATVEARQKSGEKRNDVIDLMIRIMKEEEIAAQDEDLDQFENDAKLKGPVKKAEFDELTMIANAMVMLLAGYETTATTMAWALFEITRDAKIQKKLAEEIQQFDDPSYADFMNMPYLDCVVNESLRKYPQATAISRGSQSNYVLEDVNIPIRQGHDVYVNVIGIHYDPQYYATPYEFNPDHFTREAKAARHPYAFLPFGHGPRACIGMRFAILELKIALFYAVQNFELLKCEQTPDVVEFDPKSGFTSSKHPLIIKACLRT